MKYMQVNVEYDYQTIHGLFTESVGVIVSPKLKGDSSLYSKLESFIKRKFCSDFSGKCLQGIFIAESKLISCPNNPIFDVE